MQLAIHTVHNSEVARFAAAELERYLLLIDPTLTKGTDGISLSLLLKNESRELDTVEICVEQGVGFIAGANDGALLIAVYRFLYELGCRFTHPGAGGDHIPRRTLCGDALNVTVLETPSRRHRG